MAVVYFSPICRLEVLAGMILGDWNIQILLLHTSPQHNINHTHSFMGLSLFINEVRLLALPYNIKIYVMIIGTENNWDTIFLEKVFYVTSGTKYHICVHHQVFFNVTKITELSINVLL